MASCRVIPDRGRFRASCVPSACFVPRASPVSHACSVPGASCVAGLDQGSAGCKVVHIGSKNTKAHI